MFYFRGPLLGGSWVVISGVIGPLIWVISIVTRLINLLITTHEPPSRGGHEVDRRPPPQTPQAPKTLVREPCMIRDPKST